MPSRADMRAWADGPEGAGNVGLRLPEDVVGLDVDDYGGKPGAATLAGLEVQLGRLPPTWRATSRRDPLNRIRLYRVPPGLAWPGAAGPGIDVIHHGHRYLVVAPSTHPEGREYRWVRPDGTDAEPGEVPTPGGLATLPRAWADRLATTAGSGSRPGTRDRATRADLRRIRTPGDPCPPVVQVSAAARAELAATISRHDAACRHVLALARLGEQGHRGVAVALDGLKDAFVAEVAPTRDGVTAVQAEFRRLVAGAVARVVAQPTPEEDRGCCPDPADSANQGDQPGRRRIVLTRASEIEPRPVQWVWEGRIACGTLALLGGREGVGKSLVEFDVAAQVTRGRLPGRYRGTPRAVMVAAREDSVSAYDLACRVAYDFACRGFRREIMP